MDIKSNIEEVIRLYFDKKDILVKHIIESYEEVYGLNFTKGYNLSCKTNKEKRLKIN